MRKFTVRELSFAAVVAAMYAVLGYFGSAFGLTFGPVQIRFAEALTVLPFLFPAAAPGLAVGCFLTNLLSPFGPMDLVFGTLATALAAFLTMKMPRWYLAGLPPVLINMAVLSPVWAWAETGGFGPAFRTALGLNALTFAAGETVACYVLGTLLMRALQRIRPLRPLMRSR